MLVAHRWHDLAYHIWNIGGFSQAFSSPRTRMLQVQRIAAECTHALYRIADCPLYWRL